MEPLELKGSTTLPVAMILIASFFATVLLAIGLVSGRPELACFCVFPLLTFLWLQWRRRYRLVLCQDHLEVHTWLGTKSVSYAGSVAEFRLQNSASVRRNAHQPVLCLRRQGKLLVSVPRGILRGEDVRRMTEFFAALEIFKKYLY